MALLDLYRSLGIIDQRLARAIAKDKKGHEAGNLVYCGIHARRQTKTADGKHTKRVIVATALFPPEEEGGAWTMRAWTPLIGAWVPYRQAIAAFHASDYAFHVDGKGETDKERWAEAASHVEDALASLVRDELEPGMGYVVMVAGHACRRMWTGLHNENQSYQEDDITDPRTWLPGYGKGKNAPRKRPTAVIRMNVAPDEVPQWVPVPRESDPDTEKESILFASAKLHRADVDFGSPFWILFNIPRNQAKGGDLGKTFTRWDAVPGKGGEEGERETNELKTPWWAVTATEIYPVGVANGVDRTMLARATARLCHQTVAWSDRSRYPCLCMQRSNWISTIPSTGGRRRPKNRETKPQTNNRRDARKRRPMLAADVAVSGTAYPSATSTGGPASDSPATHPWAACCELTAKAIRSKVAGSGQGHPCVAPPCSARAVVRARPQLRAEVGTGLLCAG